MRMVFLVALLIAVALFGLLGCAGPQAAQVIRDPVEVKVMVKVPCDVPEVKVPAWKTDEVARDDPRLLIRGGRALMAEIDQRAAYENALRAALRTCAAGPAGNPR